MSGPIAVLAPMTGITDVVFRRLAARFGATLVVTEMVAADSYLLGREEARLRSEGEGISPHVVQLVGRDPARMAEAARVAEQSGADMIDINMGCPAKKVTGGFGGSALMREPCVASSIVGSVVAAVAIPVTVKMRLGWCDDTRNAADLARTAVSLGAQAFTVHGRTRQQFYKGAADWRAIAEVVAAVDAPVLANGDVTCAATAKSCLRQSGASGVMIGRAALGQPWIIGDIGAALAGAGRPSPTPAVRSAAACEHYEGLLGLYGRVVGAKHARKHLAAYADRAADEGYGLGPAERAEIVTSGEPQRVLELLGRIYHEPLRRAA